jgi:hypothetical protein
LETLNYIFACYAMHLGTGHSLSFRNIRSGTIRGYLLAAASLVMSFDRDPSGRDARKELGQSTLCFPLDKVLKELKRWEDVPKRREPYSLAMQFALMAQTKDVNPLGLLPALADWFGVMLQAGGRRSEWAQDRGRSRLTSFELNHRGDPMAFCLGDIEFLSSERHPISHQAALASPSQVSLVRLCWRTQKNGQHGDHRLYSRNVHNPSLDMVAFWLSILHRFISLVGFRSHLPLALYLDEASKVPKFITSADIELHMRRLAVEVYQLDPRNKRDALGISQFSAHSLRVGGCVVLQACGFEAHTIQRLLRWTSDSWMVYTRNLVVVTQHHNKAMADAALFPTL